MKISTLENVKFSVGLTQFIDFTVRQTMLAKMNKVNDIKNQGEYHPVKDHWKQLRERIKLCYEQHQSLDQLDSLLTEVHERKINSYTEAIKALKKFTRNKKIEWFDPPKSIWTSTNGLVVRSSPELGLVIDGVPHLIKLFFKGSTEKINERNIQPILTLMLEAQAKDPYPPNIVFAVLNVKTAKIHVATQANPKILQALQLEAQTFENIWRS